jgi:serine/threonine-protein kinase
MGTVYEARHEHLGSQVALKFLHPDLGARQPLVARFLQEARVSASIKSPHVTQVVDVDETPDGNAYFVMELLEGESLEHRLERGKPLPVSEAVDIGLQMLSGLEVAHARGIVHRDLKPDNVWLTPGPRGPHVKLLDFGIAKLKATDEFRKVETRPGSMMGTPAYMAPEQAISADQVDHRADLYSFGVILYEMLSGHRPVDAEEPQEILEQLVRGDVYPLATRNPALPHGLAALVDHLVAPNPDERPASAAVVRNELFGYARESSTGFDVSARLSVPVPDTVPPDDRSPPQFVRANKTELGNASTEVATPKTRTASMPAVLEATPRRSEPPPTRRRGALGWVLAVLAVALVAGGLWAYENQSVFFDDIPPPLPTAIPSPAPSPPPAVDIVIDEPRVPAGQRRAAGPARSPTSSTPYTPSTEQEPAPTVPFPFQIPSALPIPSGLIPSALPPFFQNIPGFQEPPKPASPSASGSAP